MTSYSIKEIEKLYGFERTAEVAGGDESVVLFEQWLEAGEDSLLEGIRAYNEEDCRSTVALHEWLLGLRPDGLPWQVPPEQREQTEEAEERDATRIALHEALLDGRGGGRARAGSSRTSSTTTAARRSRSGGSGSTTSRSTRTS